MPCGMHDLRRAWDRTGQKVGGSVCPLNILRSFSDHLHEGDSAVSQL